jgi:hypothetical protein
MTRALLIALILSVFYAPLHAQQASQAIDSLETRVTALEGNVGQLPSELFVSFLFGAFCALWAMNTNRNAWLWFFLGLIFSVLTVIVLLYKNASDRRNRPPLPKRPFKLGDFRKQ